MFLFGHLGITLAATHTFEKVILSQGKKKLAGLIDYRLVLLGSMLPDIIDKPLGGLIFKATLGNGRIYAHTLIFLLLLGGTGIFFWVKDRRPGMLALAGGSLIHHILDGMWRFPGTYLWPFSGWSFPKGDPEGWLWQWLSSLATNPWVYIPEIVGGVILFCFFGKLANQKRVRIFITTGKTEPQSECINN